VDIFDEDLEALRMLITPLSSSRKDLRAIKAELSGLREVVRTGSSTDTPALRDMNDREARRRAIESSIQAKAAAQPDVFMNYVRGLNLHDMDEASKYSDLIEAITRKCSQWRDFLINELDRVILLYERSNSRSVFQALQGFAFLEFCRDSSVTEAVRKRYAAELRSSSTAVRLLALNIFSGFRISDDAAVREALSKCLSHADWKVRWEAEKLLAEEQLLPIGYRPSVVDRLRRGLAR
jgi:hypothetical protein